MGLDEMRLAVYPGQGLVARFERIVLMIVGDSVGPAAASLVEVCRSAPVVGEALRKMVEGGESKLPSFCVLSQAAEGIGVYVHGTIRVTASLEHSRLDFAATEAGAWLEETLRGKVIAIAAAEKMVRTGAAPLLDLIAGVVSGAAIELVDRSAALPAAKPAHTPAPKAAPPPLDPVAATPPPSPPATEQPQTPAQMPEPDLGETVMMPPVAALSEAEAGNLIGPSFEQQKTIASETMKPEPAPVATVVEGRSCASGHLNDPLAEQCWTCSAPLTDRWLSGNRPPLGRLTSKDGQTVLVDRNLMIGRKPDEAPGVVSGAYSKLSVPGDLAAVSRVHAEIRLDQWNVLISDLESSNGTFIRPPGVGEWVRLEPGHGVKIAHGCAISVGPYELLFEKP